MSESSLRGRTPSAEAQLRAMANGVDRANRPSGLLLIGAAAALGFLLYASITFAGWMHARSAYLAQAAKAREIDKLMADWNFEKAKSPDLEKLFPPLRVMGSDIETEAQKVFAGAPGLPVQGLVVSAKTQGRIWQPNLASVLDVYTVDCQANDLPLEKICTWISNVEKNTLIGNVFLGKLSLNPAQSGWQGLVTFAAYEKKR